MMSNKQVCVQHLQTSTQLMLNITMGGPHKLVKMPSIWISPAIWQQVAFIYTLVCFLDNWARDVHFLEAELFTINKYFFLSVQFVTFAS